MTDDPIPADLRDFILRYVDSVAQLEALLLLYWERSVDWSGAKLSKRLYIGEGEASAILARLTADGLATESEGTFGFGPRIPEHEEVLHRLANVYSGALIPVTNLIHSKPGRIREFSDAFKLRKD